MWQSRYKKVPQTNGIVVSFVVVSERSQILGVLSLQNTGKDSTERPPRSAL